MAKTYNSVPDKASGDVFTEAMWDDSIKTNINNFRVPAACAVARSGQASMTNGTKFVFSSTAELDTEAPGDPMHSSVTNNTRVTIRTAGIYLVTGFVEWANNATNGLRTGAIQKNGGNVAYASVPANGVYSLGCCPVYLGACIVGDYFELLVSHDVGSGITNNGRLQVLWVGQAS